MEEKKNEFKKNINDEEAERIFDATWDNWSSRGQWEHKHIPNYI